MLGQAGSPTVLATNGGPHSPESLARLTLDSIISVAPTASGQSAEAGRGLQKPVYEILVRSHRTVQDALRAERKALHDGNKLVEATIGAIQDAAQGNFHELYFKQEHVIIHLRQVLHRDFATTQDIELKWHADSKR